MGVNFTLRSIFGFANRTGLACLDMHSSHAIVEVPVVSISWLYKKNKKIHPIRMLCSLSDLYSHLSSTFEVRLRRKNYEARVQEIHESCFQSNCSCL